MLCSSKDKARSMRAFAIPVVPAEAGTQVCQRFGYAYKTWIPAFAGMTEQAFQASARRLNTHSFSVDAALSNAYPSTANFFSFCGSVIPFSAA
jgi:hypothetical protein